MIWYWSAANACVAQSNVSTANIALILLSRRAQASIRPTQRDVDAACDLDQQNLLWREFCRSCRRALGRESTGRRKDSFVLVHGLKQLESATFDDIEKLAQEGLMVRLAQRLVALREVVAFL